MTITEQIAIDVHLPPTARGGDGRGRPRRPLEAVKELPPKYFYDERGSQLFEQITELPEYYPTRAERAILERRARPRSSPPPAAPPR